MAEQDSTKQGQVSGMDQHDTAEKVPPQKDPVQLGIPQQGTPEPAAGAGAMLEPELQAQIGRQLRAVYDEVVNEPVPDRFLKLLEALERDQAERS